MRRCRTSCGKRSKIAALSSLGILLAGVQTILSRIQFSNHKLPSNLKFNFSDFGHDSGCGLPLPQRRDARWNYVSWRQPGLALTEPYAKLRSYLPFSAPGWSRVTAWRKVCSPNRSVRSDNLGWLAWQFARKLFHCAEVVVSHLRAGLSTGRLQWPAWPRPHHACLLAHGAFPHARILHPACSAIFLREHPDVYVRAFLFQAC